MKIISIRAIEILDSRGNPTLKTFVTLDDGTVGTASVPSGASTGSHEALELRDSTDHYFGTGVQHAVQDVQTIIDTEIRGMDINHLDKIDQRMLELDGTDNKSVLGANAILSVSLACARAFAQHHHTSLWDALNDFYFDTYQAHFPRLMVNIINGGAHANWNLDIQECMIVPKDRLPSTSIEIAANVFHTLKKLLEEKNLSTGVGDEGGFAPQLPTNSAAFDLIQRAIQDAGYTTNDIDIATDIAASEFYKDGTYVLHKDGPYDERTLSSSELSDYYSTLISQYGIMSLEDPFHEDDWYAFSQFTEHFGKDHMIVGDDLYVTNSKRLEKGIKERASNAILIKVNQIGSLFETVTTIKMAKKAGWKIIISHRSGETEDSFISDLAVAAGADFIKAGSMSRSERLAKYNRLLEIEKIEW